MTIVVTGATGRLGHLVVDALLRRGLAPDEIVATGRNVDKAKDLADRGVTVRRTDFADSESLVAAFRGADRVLLVSADNPAERVANHVRAIDAARAAGVQWVAYTSQSNAETAQMLLAQAHRETEHYLKNSGLRYVILRNGWYLENYTSFLPITLGQGFLVGSAGEGRINPVAIADLAEAAAVVLTSDGHEGQFYELGGDQDFSLAELAATISTVTGRQIEYRDVPPQEMAETLAGAGLPAEVGQVFADSDLGLARGELLASGGTLRRLIGRPTTTAAEVISAAVQQGTPS
jgi:NAD(P)H dehydrogenase (quinone)